MRAPAALLLLALGACTVNVSGAKCDDDSNCPAGQGCGTDQRCSEAAVCPPVGKANGLQCQPADVDSCALGVAESCVQSAKNISPSCRVWKFDDCPARSLVCSSSVSVRCDCPALGGSTVWVDPTATDVVLAHTGVQNPPACRYGSVAAGLAAPGVATVVATGWTAGMAAPMVFTEGPLVVPDGVALTTDDAPADPTHYAIRAGPTVGANSLVALGAGSMISGFTLENTAATGDAIRTNCATALATVTSVRINGLGTGTGPPHFATGVHHTGSCKLTVHDSVLTGLAESGIVIESLASALDVDLSRNLVYGNTATWQTAIGLNMRSAGGILFKGGSQLPVMTFHGNKVCGNSGDQILVAISGGTLDLRGGTALADCVASPSPRNIIYFQTGGAGVAAPDTTTVHVDFDEFTTQPLGVNDTIGTLVTGSVCPQPPSTSCP